MQDNAQVSIIMPVYNAAKFLDRSIGALINQTYKNIEILCINDGSADNSLEILNKYAQKDARIKVFNQGNMGPATARNVGLDNSAGKYIMFCDADDRYEPEMVEQMVKTIQEQDIDLVVCDVNIIRDGSKRQIDSNNPYEKLSFQGIINFDTEKKLERKIKVFLWKKIFKKSLINKYNIRFPDGLKADDLIFIQEYVLVSHTAYGLKRNLYNYYLTLNSIMDKVTKNKTKDYFEQLLAFKSCLCFASQIPNISHNKQIYLLDNMNARIKYWSKLVQKNELNVYIYLIYEMISLFNYPIEKSKYPILYYANKKDFLKVKRLLLDFRPKNPSFFERIFSIRNSYDKRHKVVSLLGLKVNIRRKVK